jgi:hypothetical protein
MAGSIESHWFVEKRVRLLTAIGHLDMPTVKVYDEESRLFYDALTLPVHVIIDVRQLKSVPPLSELLKMATLWHKRVGMVVTVQAMRQPLMRLIFTTIVSIGHLKYRDVNTIAQAMETVAGRDASLPPLDTWKDSPFAETSL